MVNGRPLWISAERGEAATKIGVNAEHARESTVRGLIRVIQEAKTNEPAQTTAAVALGNMGREAEAAIPTLVSLLADNDYRGEPAATAVHALARIGPACIPSLAEALQNRDSNVRLGPISALAEMKLGPEMKTAVPALAAALQDGELDVCYAAAQLLGRVGTDAKGAMPALIELLQSDYPWTRLAAAEALSRMELEGRAVAAAAFIELLKEGRPRIRAAASQALEAIKRGRVPSGPPVEPSPQFSIVQDYSNTMRSAQTSPDGKIRLQLCHDPDTHPPQTWRRLVEVATGKRIGRPLHPLGVSPDEQLACWSFSPDGEYVATGTQSRGEDDDGRYNIGHVQLWDAATGKLVASAGFAVGSVLAVGFAPAGRQVWFTSEGYRREGCN